MWLASAGFARVDNSFHLWTKVFFALCKHLYFFGAMSRRKILSYFQREKIENEFHEEESHTRLPNLKPRNFQTKWFNVIVNYALFPAIAKLSPEAVELAQRLLNFRMPGLSEGSLKQTTMHILIPRV